MSKTTNFIEGFVTLDKERPYAFTAKDTPKIFALVAGMSEGNPRVMQEISQELLAYGLKGANPKLTDDVINELVHNKAVELHEENPEISIFETVGKFYGDFVEAIFPNYI